MLDLTFFLSSRSAFSHPIFLDLSRLLRFPVPNPPPLSRQLHSGSREQPSNTYEQLMAGTDLTLLV